jgi:hypothetical protein
MISQSLYQVLCECINFAIGGDYSIPGLSLPPDESNLADEVKQFVKPYVLIIHRPSGHGFYLNREYRHILDVLNCQEPTNPVEVARHYLCASPNLPFWKQTECSKEFDTFWLY